MLAHDIPSIPYLRTTARCFLATALLLLGACDEAHHGDDPAAYREATLEAPATVVSMGIADGLAWVATVDGRIKGWGEPYCDASGCPLPAEIDPLELGPAAVEVLADGQRSVARLADGTVVGWTVGALGVSAPAPVDLGTTESVVQLALGEGLLCARLEGGTVTCQGPSGVEAPAAILHPPLTEPAIDLTAGAVHACAVLQTGAVQCWGSNDAKQLGALTAAGAALVPLSGPAGRVVAGGEHTCALLETGEVQCWGEASDGQLGHAGPGVGTVPLEQPAVRIAAGARHSCAITSDGSLYCWGNDDEGQLGQGDDDGVVRRVDLGEHRATEVFSGPTASTTFALLDHGGLRGWGSSDAGQLGQGDALTNTGSTTWIVGKLPDIIIYDGDDAA